MTLVFWLIGAAVVFVIAAVAVGRVTANLASAPERSVFDADQSLEFVAEALPSELTAELSYDEVRRILRLFHDYLHDEGVATTAGGEADTAPAVVDLDAAADYVVRRASLADITVRRADAQAVIDAQMAYFDAIGAIGEPVEGPDDPDGVGRAQG
jgi:hypothetical protein